MIYFFGHPDDQVLAVDATLELKDTDKQKLSWLFGNASELAFQEIKGPFNGPRREMITPWSTNAVEIAFNMGIQGINRIEKFYAQSQYGAAFDPMLQAVYEKLNGGIFKIDRQPEPVTYVEDIARYNEEEGLALSKDEVNYLTALSKKLGRRLTDSEVFGFSQVNSEHCRHKIFNGRFIIDGAEKPETLFQWIKRTTKLHPNRVVSAYKDNVAFLQGPEIEQFAPERQDKAAFFKLNPIRSVLSLKAETHNFPTTVEPFNGAATGAGGEIRDRLAGGKGSMPLAGTAVYMTSYPRTAKNRKWEEAQEERPWLYQTPAEILIKASNGASDFGNKYGQPLINGSLLTFEHQENKTLYGFDKVIMLAGGIGYARLTDAEKDTPEKDQEIIVMGGDNYRIGMGGGSVSSVNTGKYTNAIELNAVQRANPEMQKRVANAIRAMAEMGKNPIVAIHDHGAGGHLNALSELVEATGGWIDIAKLPVGDPTLSDKEIIGNESQERMGLLLKSEHLDLLKKIAKRERAPLYAVGKTTGDHRFTFHDKASNIPPMDLELADMFGNPPQMILEDATRKYSYRTIEADNTPVSDTISQVLQLEAVACKDWLTNKADRSVTGKVACQQTTGEVQLPLNDLGAVALDYQGISGMATAIGHAPVSALIDAGAGSRISLAEALTNLLWAPLTDGLHSVSLSANWMWPANNPGENARLYKAVESLSELAIDLGINIPTGKDSLSMTQQYPDGKVVYAPGTVIISATAEVTNIRKIVKANLQNRPGSKIIFVRFTEDDMPLGGSSFGQIQNRLGTQTPDVTSAVYLKKAFHAIQDLIHKEEILAGHDISAGGLITALLEMTFADNRSGIHADLQLLMKTYTLNQVLFGESPGVIIQVSKDSQIAEQLQEQGVLAYTIGTVNNERSFTVKTPDQQIDLSQEDLRDDWFRSSYLLDRKQAGETLAAERFRNYKTQVLAHRFPQHFKGTFSQYNLKPAPEQNKAPKAAIIREKGVNGDREMAYSLYLAGFDVKDIHMTDLIAGHEDLSDIQMIAFAGGFSNSDVLGSAKGWAGAFLYNKKAREALDAFYEREDTLSLGVCNGCQLMIELGVLNPKDQYKPRMLPNKSGKFESAFVNVSIPENNSVMLHSLAGSTLGIWVAHGEGRFSLPNKESHYNIAARYSYDAYPGNPNGSDFQTAALSSENGRHLAIMPHLERSIFPWNWAHYPENRKEDELSPWLEAFINARKWVEKQQ